MKIAKFVIWVVVVICFVVSGYFARQYHQECTKWDRFVSKIWEQEIPEFDSHQRSFFIYRMTFEWPEDDIRLYLDYITASKNVANGTLWIGDDIAETWSGLTFDVPAGKLARSHPEAGSKIPEWQFAYNEEKRKKRERCEKKYKEIMEEE